MKLLNFITCDDIRQEISNKITLVGAFDDLVINFLQNESWPITTRIGFLVRLKKESESENPDYFHFQILVKGDLKSEFKGPLVVNKEKDIIGLVIVINTFTISGPSQIDFKLIIKDGERIINTFEPESLKVTSSINP